MSKRSYSGPALDHTYQYFHERPAARSDDDDVVYATDPEDAGEETTENVPMAGEDDEDEPIKIPGQSTLKEWGGSDE